MSLLTQVLYCPRCQIVQIFNSMAKPGAWECIICGSVVENGHVSELRDKALSYSRLSDPMLHVMLKLLWSDQ